MSMAPSHAEPLHLADFILAYANAIFGIFYLLGFQFIHSIVDSG